MTTTNTALSTEDIAPADVKHYRREDLGLRIWRGECVVLFRWQFDGRRPDVDAWSMHVDFWVGDLSNRHLLDEVLDAAQGLYASTMSRDPSYDKAMEALEALGYEETRDFPM